MVNSYLLYRSSRPKPLSHVEYRKKVMLSLCGGGTFAEKDDPCATYKGRGKVNWETLLRTRTITTTVCCM